MSIRFIIQLLSSINLSVKKGECESFACAQQPVWQTGFLLYKYSKQVFYCTKYCCILVMLFGQYSLHLDNNSFYCSVSS